ncbi:conserved membrane hypothetical protein [[Clostridium] ultunense Esp]|uniref:Uncharacterized protein n=1 Tax=[Clostridium] ultunense Esp TaxID=1288971 RepID=M1ZH02_9FIRM|nr:hypothetical protein [Schnuerera ultunensis]CCQ97588.1 conserved membrane hypothetical protein [[Clostridium] ultunense Esp]SHD77214.1 conserved membrane protein of unknown function [[Clostridium] ultunense Esp]
MRRTNRIVTLLIILLLLFSYEEFSYCNDNFNIDTNVYIVVVNKLTLSDIEKMPNLKGLMYDGSFGLMNVRGISGYRGADSFITINASNKAFANNESSQFHNMDSRFKKIYENRVSVLDKDYKVGNIQTGRLYNQNENNKYSPYLGALGQVLHNGGLKTAVFGNSDIDEELIRTSALIPMDSKGLIDYGNIDNILIEDGSYPYGFRTDYDKILNEIFHIKSKASLIVVDTGDLSRLNSYSNFLSKDGFHEKRNTVLEGIDVFIGNLLNIIDKDKSLLMVLSPNSGEERIDGNRLAPIFLWGKGVEPGVPISSTTNRPGIISNLDISPTIVNFFNLTAENMSGSIIKHIEKEDAFSYISSINGRINLMSKIRSKTLLTYGTISIIAVLIILIMLIFKIKLNNRIGEWLKTILLVLFSLPVILIISSLFYIDNLLKFVISLILLLGLFAYTFKRFNSNKMIYIITYSYFILIVLDILFNGYITKFSIMSHDPIIGARYFGIGNEMVGLFLTASTLTAGLLYEKCENKIVSILALFISIALVGHPKLGANVGGTIALLSASLYFVLELMNKQLNYKSIILGLVLVSLAITIFGYIDIKLNPTPTHLGGTLLSIKDKGISIIKNIIDRKLLMNIRLVGISSWTKVTIINLFVQVIISYIFEFRINRMMNSGLGKGYLSCIIGSIVGFLLNDSGLILSAISINLITIFLLFIIINAEEMTIE